MDELKKLEAYHSKLYLIKFMNNPRGYFSVLLALAEVRRDSRDLQIYPRGDATDGFIFIFCFKS